jgi:hypothetical protein
VFLGSRYALRPGDLPDRSMLSVDAGDQFAALLACGVDTALGGMETHTTLPEAAVFTASSTWHSETAPAMAFDGDTTTDWNAGAFAGERGQWIEVDFGSLQTLVGIEATVAQFSQGFPSFFTNHEITLDGMPALQWAGETRMGQILSHTFEVPQLARVVRITTTVSRSWISWWEIGFVFGPPPTADCRE